MNRGRVIIGVDPDIKKSGFAVWVPDNKRFLEVTTYTKPDMMQKIFDYSMGYDIHVVIEDSRIESYLYNAHKAYGATKGAHKSKLGVALKVARDVGRVDMIARDVEDYCIREGITYALISPKSRKKGVNTKVSAKIFNKMTKWEGRTNEDARDAGMLVAGWK